MGTTLNNGPSGLDSDSKLNVKTLTDIELGILLTRAWNANETHDMLIYRDEMDRRRVGS